MSNKKIQFLIMSVVMIFIICIIPHLASAQPPPPDCTDPDKCPIDGGLSVLLAAGVGYGVKKYRESRKGMQKNIEQI